MTKTGRATWVVVSVLCYFFCFAGRGLRADFTHDDLMNLYRSWYPPVAQHVLDIVVFFKFSESYRPLGSLFYRLFFEAFGMHAFPYRLACYGLIFLNLWLAYCVVKRLSRSREVAIVAIALFAYHPGFAALYFNTGVCYDLLCFCFYMTAFIYYLKHRHPGWGQVAVWSVLYVLCLDSKEMAVTLPVMICVYELLRRKRLGWMTWILSDSRIPVTGIAITLLFVFGRVYSAGGLPSIGGYKTEYHPAVYLARANHFLSVALYDPTGLPPMVAVLLFVALVAVAIWSRWLPLRFAVAWMPIGILPVAFIPERGLDAVTIPALGFAMAIALLMTELSRRLFRFEQRPAALFASVLLLMFSLNRQMLWIDYSAMFPEGKQIRSVYVQLRAIQPVFRRGSRILFLHDPFPEMTWASRYLVSLYTNDRTVGVYRLDQPAAGLERNFNFVFSYEYERLAACSLQSLSGGISPATVCRPPIEPRQAQVRADGFACRRLHQPGKSS